MADEIDFKLIGDDLQAVIITLDPGVYSAGDFGVNGATGITLVEVSDVP